MVWSSLGRETGTSSSLWDVSTTSPFIQRADGRVFALTASNVVASSGAPVSHETVRLYATLNPGRYVILPATQFPGQEASFGLIVESTSSDVSVSQLWPPLVSSEDVEAHKAAKEAEARAEAARNRDAGSKAARGRAT